MKNIFKIFTGVALCALFVTSCNVENQKSTYAPVQANEASFAQSVVSDTEIEAKATSFDVQVVRGSAKDALTLSIDGSGLPVGITAPATVSFAAGEYQAALKLDISAMEVGTKYTGKISLKDSTQYNKNMAITSCKVTFAKAYTWLEIGKGEFYDPLALQPNDDDLGIIEVEFLKADGFDRWRMLNPFPAEKTIAAWAESYYAGNQSTVWEFYKTGDEEGSIKFEGVIYTGLFYAALGSNTYITYYFPSEYSSSYAKYDVYNGFVEDNVVQIYCPQIIENTTAWFGMGAKYIRLPGGSVKSLEEWWLSI